MSTITTIPLTKLTVVINNFISNTITHLNKLSVKGDQKLSEFDNKLNDLDAMTTLLEAKLNSLPEKITSTYPPLPNVTLDDLNPIIIQNPIRGASDHSEGTGNESKRDLDEQKNKEGEKQKDEDGIDENLSPEEDLENFLKSNESLRDLYKMLKYGVSTMQVLSKAKLNGIDESLVNELIEKAKAIHPNIS